MSQKVLLQITACAEAATGVALLASPNIVAQLLLRERLESGGLVVARLVGISLLALAVAAWIGRGIPGRGPSLAAMLTYNVLVTFYLTYLAIYGNFAGILLWPTTAIHAVLSAFLISCWLRGAP
jgi:hypothetical protein